MRDVCDVVYVLHVEQLERQVATAQIVAATMRAAGADVEFVDEAFERARFDEVLAAEPVPESPVTALLRELG